MIVSFRSPLAALLLCVACASRDDGQGGPLPAENAPDAPVVALDTPVTALDGELAVPLPRTKDPLLQGLVIPPDAALRGMWSTTLTWPLNGLHSVLLPNGRVLTYGTPTADAATQNGRYYDVWDPALGVGTASHQTSYQAQRLDSFCSSAAFLGDGRLLVSGGNAPFESTEFLPASSTTASSPSKLADERWYGTLITLADGRPLMLGGSAPYAALRAYQDPVGAINAGTVSMTPEIYEAGTGWRSLFGAYSRDAFGPDFHRYWYPRAWVAPNGRVFGISSEKLWYLDPTGDGSLAVVGNFKTGASEVTRPNIGPTSTAVMFAPGRILQVGGNGYHDGHATTGSALATVIDINGASPVVTEVQPMAKARQWANATVLANGEVLVTGGTRFGNNGGADAVYDAELWDPETQTFSSAAAAAHVRVYHSAAILMPNGAVLSTGGGAPGPVNNLNAELYYPPYLFREVEGKVELAPRPLLTAINALRFAHGAEVELELEEELPIARLSLIGTSSVTHSFNTSQRFQELAFTQSGTRLTASLPASSNVAPPGYYQIIATDSSGVPSPGVIVALGASISEPPVPKQVPRGKLVTLTSLDYPDHVVATEAGLGVLSTFAPDASAVERARSQFLARDGLADSSCVSFESLSAPGSWLRHANYRLQLGQNDGSAVFKNDATFCPEEGLAGLGITLRSKNFPTYAVHHRDLALFIDPVTSDEAFSEQATFLVEVAPFPELPAIAAPPIEVGETADYEVAITVPGAEWSWDFGDDAPSTAWSATPVASHTFEEVGAYLVSLKLRLADGRTKTKTFVQIVRGPHTAGAPRSSSALALETPIAGAPRLWSVNPDQDSVSVFDSASYEKLAEIAVGSAPRTLAVAPSGRIWVTNRDSDSISVIDPATFAVLRSIALPRASRPFGLVFAPDGSGAYVTLEGTGSVAKLSPESGARTKELALGPNPRHLSITADSKELLVSRFITRALPGENTALVSTSSAGSPVGGEVLLVGASDLDELSTIVLRHGDSADSSVSGRGFPNYLGAAAIAPDGTSAWVPSKQDNLRRGALRDGLGLDFQNTVRAVSSRLDLVERAEDYLARIDHDDAGVASAAAFHPSGAYLFVTLETSRQVAVVDALAHSEFFRVDVGRAPQSLVVSGDGMRLYVQNFMDRSVSVVDLEPLIRFGEFRAPTLATLQSVANERLPEDELRGKQLFYDARDPRLARDAYLSCASCHNDGGGDGRVWDLTGFGEGLRNTIDLRGRAGAHGLLHFSGNFDEVQDFEGQIRTFAAGTGLMSDADYFFGTRSEPLGEPKAGLSEDLDALAAYVASLSKVPPSPFRRPDGALTNDARRGRTYFARLGCPSCHNGSTFTNEGRRTLLDIGTLGPSSGQRSNGPLTGIDVPTLRGVWATAPYLHDGSAATLADAVRRHRNVRIQRAELAPLLAYLQQLDGEGAGFKPPRAIFCASEGWTCRLPAGVTATVYYGTGVEYASRSGVTGSVSCTNSAFGDPAPRKFKSCYYR